MEFGPVISAVTGVVVKPVVDSITTQLGYVWNYKTNFENLQKQLGKLQGRKAMVQHLVDEAKRNGDEIEQLVVKWLAGVNKMIDEVTQIIDDNKKAEMKCLKSLCPNLKKRYQHSKNAAVKAKDVTDLHDEGKFYRISYRPIPKETWHPAWKLYEDFESRMSTLTDVISALSSSNVNVVGVHGMGGIGKTTLAREVGRKAEELKLFDSVVFVEVSEQPDVMKIQGTIAGMLSLRFEKDTEPGRANELCERLKRERKVLLILDNIWESLDLEKVGIPLNDDHRGCKLLLTARDTNVLSKMDCQSSFSIGILNEQEAWNLFKKIAGSCVQRHDLKSLASDVAKRCGGLPIAIVTVAKALKNKQVFEWENALLELQRPSSEGQNASVTKEAYSCILLSYNRLESDELQSTFLLCCTMVLISVGSLEELLRHGLGLNLFRRIKTIEEARHRVNTLIQKLKDSSLLLETPNDECFSIHDVVRDVGKVIASSNHKNVIVDDIRDLLGIYTLENCTSISLLDVAKLPTELDCPHLTFFYMKTKTKFSIPEFSIPDNFFNGMPKLEVLQLKGMDLSELPASLRSLKKLRTLYLDCCNLGDIAIVGDMKNLEILVLFNSQSAKILLSEEIGKLNQLRLLDLRKSSFIIPPKTISRLIQLEELYMDDWYDQRQVKKFYIETSVASLEELKDLCHLTALRICVADAEILPKCMVFQKLKRYNILIGDKQAIQNQTSFLEFKQGIRETLRTLKVSSDTNLCSEDGVITQLKGIEYLLLDGKQRITNVLCELDGEGFPKLRHFRISNNPFIVCIVDSMLSATCVAFPLLETLSLSNLVRLEKICHDQLRTKCFCQLRTITVQECHELKNLFSFSIAKHLSVLQEITVVNCRNIEEIFIFDGADNGVINPVFFKSLQSFTLKKLPRLRRICSETEVTSTSQDRRMPLTMNASSSEIVLEDQLDALPLFDEKIVFPNLKHLKLDDINLKYLFSSSTLGSFNHLQHLEIKNCKHLEELIRIDDKCSNYVEFQPLEKLEIWNCPELREFIFSDKVSYPSLQEIRLYFLENLRRIWQSQVIQNVQHCQSLLPLQLLLVNMCRIKEIVGKEGEEEAAAKFSFPQLTSLHLYGLKELSCFYPGKHTTEWPKLKELMVKHCEKIDLFSFQKHDVEGQVDDYHTMQQALFSVDDHQVFLHLEKVMTNQHQKRMICQSSFSKDLFPKLIYVELVIDKSTILPHSILEKFHNLEELQLINCSYKEIFSCEEVEKHVGMFAQLKKLHLFLLYNLKQIWKQESKVDLIIQKLEFLRVSRCHNLINLMPPSAPFKNLKILKVDDCNRLISLVPASAANRLMVLEEMSVRYCKEMTEIIENQGDVMEGKITLSRLKSLELYELGKLTSFYSGNYAIIFPSLEKLSVYHCPQMKFFSSGALSTPNLQEVRQDRTNHKCKHSDLNATFEQIRDEKIFSEGGLGFKDIEMFLQKYPEHQKVFSNLFCLTCIGDEIDKLWQSQFSQQLFPNLKLLEVFEDESTVFPLAILQRFPSVGRHELKCCLYEEIFSREDFEKYTGASAQIKRLRLYRLDNLKQMWKQDSCLDLILPNMEELRVEWCGSLVTLVPPSSSFQNLGWLSVKGCDGLMNLLAPATAKSLVQLGYMEIRQCKTMTKVISSNEEAVTGDEIIFNKLWYLALDGLSSLTSFCPGNFTFTFPCLRSVSLTNCPKIKFFSSGVLNTPRLEEIEHDDIEYYCDDDLNATIHGIHEKLNAKTSPEDCAGPSTLSSSAI